ncbi:MAG TPA: response regulator, partial [Bacteroidales bacterium]
MDNKKDLILIVDDNLKNLEVLTKILKEEGFLISLAQDGGEALDQLNNITPDLILLDIMMPEMNGLEVCRRIKQNDKLKEIPVIFVTAKNQTEDLVEGFKAGGVDYISKPFQRDELLVRIKNHLELTGSRKRIIALNRTRDKIYSIIAHDI